MENKTCELIQNLMDDFNMAEDDHERAIAGAQLCGALEMILLITQGEGDRK